LSKSTNLEMSNRLKYN